MIDESKFIPGLQLSEMFYHEAVKPILDNEFAGLIYSAALIGSGSEVLGFDTSRSTDHHWGPRVLLFLSEEDSQKFNKEISLIMSKNLPYKFYGITTNFSDPDKIGVQLLEEIDEGAINHRVTIETIKSFFNSTLAVNPYNEISIEDWLTFPEQHLLSITAGKIFYDGLGELEVMREKFNYYPHDVWLHLLASQWTKISQEDAFMGRCGDAGDELGSRIIANKLIQFVMKLCLLMDKKYAPYSKWFGTGFSKLEIAKSLMPIFEQVQLATNWKDREKYLSLAYEIVAEKHNSLKITDPMETKVSPFHDRPYTVIHGENFAEAIKKQIEDNEVKQIAEKNIGSVDQFVDSTDVLSHPEITKKLKTVYE
jgi:hypothetical protein